MTAQPSPTGIAGAADHAPSRSSACHVCGGEMESPHALRAMPGVGLVAACSRECASTDGFRSEIERARAAIDAILRGRHDGWDQALARLRAEIGGGVA